jgi:hypothetical protein
MFAFRINASHAEPINDPTKIKITADMINGFIT